MRPPRSATGPLWSVVAPIRRQSSAGSTFMMRRHPGSMRECDKMKSSIMSIAMRLDDWSGRGYVGDQAEAGGACSSEHCSCWSHAELRHPFAKCPSLGTRSPVQASIPGGYVAAVRQRRRPMSRALGRDQWQPMRDCHDHRRCSRRSRICIYRPCFYYFTEVVSYHTQESTYVFDSVRLSPHH